MLDNADNTGSLLWTEEELTALFETAEPPARLGATSVGVEAGSKFFLFCACFLPEEEENLLLGRQFSHRVKQTVPYA